ncbi:hypothetical protein [Solibacillus sp. NPDC093137]|uniref:hypothetical protein n=1 Tax=Solibacillus sp. NPDC093137 TaxID=3390678 RepID=UPI003CFE7813
MKKIWLIPISLIIMFMMFTIYQQNQLIKDYRSLLYFEMSRINVPVERILAFHQEADSYDDEERTEKLERLDETFADFFNFTGSGLQLEPQISAEYFVPYNDAKIAYFHLVKNYIAASTTEDREQAYINLKKRHDQYNEFLKTSEEKLVEPFE